MKTIVCFGDSNTYGYKPDGSGRYPEHVRWTGVLQERLKDEDTRIVEEGLVGRTTVFEDSLRPGRKGIDFLYPLLETHAPVEELILMLGTNDCKTRYQSNAATISMGIERLIQEARQFDDSLKILLIAPIHLGDDVWKEGYDPEFGKESVETSKQLKEAYQRTAQKYGCDFLAASDVAGPSEIDMEHLDETGHRALADAIYQQLTVHRGR